MKISDYQLVNNIWEMPFLPPIPSDMFNSKSASHIISNRIKGEWQFRFSPITDIPSPYAKCQNYNFSAIDSDWDDVIVPSALNMQDYNIKNNQEYYYKKIITASKHTDNRAFIRFEGVYCNARIWLNGDFITTHIGGFTPFDIEITNYLDANNQCELTVGIADIEGKNIGVWNSDGTSMSNISWASYYAHNNICGILRNVTIYYLPKSFILSYHIKSDLTDRYTKGRLSLNMLIVSKNIDNAKIRITARDSRGKVVCDGTLIGSTCKKVDNELYTKSCDLNIERHTYYNNKDKEKDLFYSKRHIRFVRCELQGELYSVSASFEKLDILPWTAELPQLYNVEIEVTNNDTKLCEYSENVGFRTLEYGGANGTDRNKLYINGCEIKLRGVCRHDISNRYGRSLTQEDELSEIISLKRNNVNHIRTSHYPASQNYIKLCDQHGIYVELENAVCFKGGNGYELLCAPEEIMQSLSEMMEFYHNNPSVIILSSGNESGFEKSIGFRRSYEYIKEQDTSRPAIFSYPLTVKSKPLPYDIFSKHYRVVTKFLGDKNIPKLHDEFAHVACYNLDDLVDDNNFRLAWGKSIMKGWDKMLADDGALGCAIWGGIDDVFYLPTNVESAHQRHSSQQAVGYGEWGCVLDVFKREKPEAYLTKKAFSPIKVLEQSINANTLTLKLANRFDHTNLNKVECIVRNNFGKELFSGVLPCEISPKQTGTVALALMATVQDSYDISLYYGGYEIDREVYNVTDKEQTVTTKNVLAVAINSDDIKFVDGQSIVADKLTFLRNAKPMKVKSRKILNMDTSSCKKTIVKDDFGNLQSVKYTLTSVDNGINIKVTLSPLLRCFVGEKFAVAFNICQDVKSVSWNKNCDLTYYPPNHLERKVGRAMVAPQENNQYGISPNFSWKEDGCNYFSATDTEQERVYVTNDFKTARTDINSYDVEMSSSAIRVKKLGDKLNCYTSYAKEKQYVVVLSDGVIKEGSWRITHRNSIKQCLVSRKKDSAMAFEFDGVGVRILGTRSKKQGKISIYIDEQFCKTVDTRSDICDVLDFMVLDTVADLPNGKHTITIRLDDNFGVRISGFEVINLDSNIKSRLAVGVGSYYRSLAWGNYYGERMTLKQRKGFSCLLTSHMLKENNRDSD